MKLGHYGKHTFKQNLTNCRSFSTIFSWIHFIYKIHKVQMDKFYFIFCVLILKKWEAKMEAETVKFCTTVLKCIYPIKPYCIQIYRKFKKIIFACFVLKSTLLVFTMTYQRNRLINTTKQSKDNFTISLLMLLDFKKKTHVYVCLKK